MMSRSAKAKREAALSELTGRVIVIGPLLEMRSSSWGQEPLQAGDCSVYQFQPRRWHGWLLVMLSVLSIDISCTRAILITEMICSANSSIKDLTIMILVV